MDSSSNIPTEWYMTDPVFQDIDEAARDNIIDGNLASEYPPEYTSATQQGQHASQAQEMAENQYSPWPTDCSPILSNDYRPEDDVFDFNAAHGPGITDAEVDDYIRREAGGTQQRRLPSIPPTFRQPYGDVGNIWSTGPYFNSMTTRYQTDHILQAPQYPLSGGFPMAPGPIRRYNDTGVYDRSGSEMQSRGNLALPTSSRLTPRPTAEAQTRYWDPSLVSYNNDTSNAYVLPGAPNIGDVIQSTGAAPVTDSTGSKRVKAQQQPHFSQSGHGQQWDLDAEDGDISQSVSKRRRRTVRQPLRSNQPYRILAPAAFASPSLQLERRRSTRASARKRFISEASDEDEPIISEVSQRGRNQQKPRCSMGKDLPRNEKLLYVMGYFSPEPLSKSSPWMTLESLAEKFHQLDSRLAVKDVRNTALRQFKDKVPEIKEYAEMQCRLSRIRHWPSHKPSQYVGSLARWTPPDVGDLSYIEHLKSLPSVTKGHLRSGPSTPPEGGPSSRKRKRD